VVANFELFGFAPPDESYDMRSDQHRIQRISSEVRKLVARADMFTLLDRGRADESPEFGFHACRACVWSWARSRGAKFVIVGQVIKESRSMLWAQMKLLDVERRAVVANASLLMHDDSGRIWKAAGENLTSRVLREFRNKRGRKAKGSPEAMYRELPLHPVKELLL
jgi:hypothetical protein